MANLSLKNIPDALYEALRQSAELNRRSINAEVTYRLEQALMPVRRDKQALLASINQLHAELQLDTGEVDPVDISRFKLTGRH